MIRNTAIYYGNLTICPKSKKKTSPTSGRAGEFGSLFCWPNRSWIGEGLSGIVSDGGGVMGSPFRVAGGGGE